MPKTATSTAVAGSSSPQIDGQSRSGPPWPDVGATQSTEVRWFVPGDGPPLEGAPVRSCVDNYRGEMLADGVSVKSRDGDGAGVFVKVRCAVLAPVEVGGLRGAPETWMRWEIGALPHTDEQVHSDVYVHKVIARRKGVEVAHLVVHDQAWWSVAVRVRGLESPRLPREIELHLEQSEAYCCSYPGWLGLHTNLCSSGDAAR